jgi:predicted TIM-barrel fold metal-dependent hydrolase
MMTPWIRWVLWCGCFLVILSPGHIQTVAAQDEDRPLYKTRYRVINVHRHCDNPSEAALKAEFDVMQRVGFSAMVNLLIDGGWSDRNLPGWLELQKKHADHLVVFGSINLGKSKSPTFFADLVQEMEVQKRLGAHGVKVWKNLGMYAKDADGKLIKLDDRRLDPFWARCGELELPILLHVADPKEYWYPLTYNSFHYGLRSEKDQHDKNPNMPSWEELIRQRDAVLKKHPRTIIIGAHMGSMTFELQKLAETLDRYPNFHIDTSARLRILGRLNPRAVRDFFVKYQDRILFGTDSSVLYGIRPDDADGIKKWQDKTARFYSRHLEYFETDHINLVEPYGYAKDWLRLAGAKLPPEVLEKLYHGNAERLIPALRLKPAERKPVSP